MRTDKDKASEAAPETEKRGIPPKKVLDSPDSNQTPTDLLQRWLRLWVCLSKIARKEPGEGRDVVTPTDTQMRDKETL